MADSPATLRKGIVVQGKLSDGFRVTGLDEGTGCVTSHDVETQREEFNELDRWYCSALEVSDVGP